jgi:hypothetical protein
MFGYVQTFKPELKFKEFDIYRSYYCGLCMKIKEKYGNIARISINYDMVFLIMLLSSLYEPKTEYTEKRCIASPVKHPVRINEITDYAADMLILYAYFKAEDDVRDEHRIRGFAESIYLSGKYAKLCEKYPQKTEKLLFLSGIMEQEAKGKCENIEDIPDKSAEMISILFDYKKDEWQENLKKIGFYLGKFIYYLDAFDDVEKDIKKKLYNPLKNDFKALSVDEFGDKCRSILTENIALCSMEIEKLPLIENLEIINNILYLGVWNKFDRIQKKRKQEESSK